jgi:hypothetical protein
MLDIATRLAVRDLQTVHARRHLVDASSLAFVVFLLISFVVLRRRLRRQIRRNELSMTYLPW